MFSLHNIFDGKPDHPMFDVKEAKRLLAGLPKGDAFKALDETTSWLISVKDTSGFRPEVRAEIIMLLDETGQPLHAEVLRQYLGTPHLQDFQGLHQWQGIHGFMQALAEAYAVCISEYRQAEKKPWDLKENIPVICVRLLRAVAETDHSQTVAGTVLGTDPHGIRVKAGSGAVRLLELQRPGGRPALAMSAYGHRPPQTHPLH